jgi:hypothetical protein
MDTGKICGPGAGYDIDEAYNDKSGAALDAIEADLALLGEGAVSDLLFDLLSDAMCNARVERDDLTDRDFALAKSLVRCRLAAILTDGAFDAILTELRPTRQPQAAFELALVWSWSR